MWRWIFTLSVLAALCAAFASWYVIEKGDAGRTVTLAGQTISVSVADSEATRAQGLSGRSGLGENEGMLFIFPIDGTYGFWMKDMRFSIDIIWIAEDSRIVHIEPQVSPETYPNVFQPPVLARYVLELPAGWTSQYQVKRGDVVDL